MLLASLQSLRDTADDFSRVEVLIRLDFDDGPSLQAVDRFAEFNARILVGLRGNGYGDLHEYVNECCRAAYGQHLLLWNDDARMCSQGWDSRLASIAQPGLYYGTFNVAYGWCFPFIPRELFELLGHVARRPFYDSWLGDICMVWQSGIPFVYFDDIQIEHTYQHDLTFQERQPVVDQGNLFDRHSSEVEAWKRHDHAKIVQALAQAASSSHSGPKSGS